MTASMPSENKISTTQALNLWDYFRQEQRHGGYADLNLSEIDWQDLNEAQRRKIWWLITHSDKERLIKFLYSIGAKNN